MNQKEEITAEVQILLKEAENPLAFSRKPENVTKVGDLSRKIDTFLNDPSVEKNERAHLLNEKSRILNLLDSYSKDAEDALTKSIKLNPGDLNTWNILGNVLWKKKDYVSARKTLESAIDQFGKNKESLRYLSMVLRFIDDPKERTKNVAKSVEYAKEAVGQDIKDGESWYVLGNAYLHNYFANSRKLVELQTALKAYTQAELNSKWDNPDLYYNRGEIQLYLEEYNQAIDSYNRAHTLDESLNAKEKSAKIIELNDAIQYAVDNKGKYKPKKLAVIVKSIPTVLKTQPKHLGDVKYTIKALEDCAIGENKGCILSCKVTNVITKKSDVPARFVIVDFKATFGCVSIYHCNDEIYEKISEQTEIYVVNPVVKNVKFSLKDKEYNYLAVQVFDPDSIWIDANKDMTIFSPSEITHKNLP
eukprot:CAMPEP_0176438464 /NCGR_PEP_ID=MMETSP0127-20121128/19300_1 /TAXON_ID=938130 /ORGANISM="Platyophrya macrostoma, Strain WH" /LENGTH=417 /DNA_ID=CAMNT_0017822421 /DNA_START=740 /DNA_END=1993 /DNA_ORIENTATION=+